MTACNAEKVNLPTNNINNITKIIINAKSEDFSMKQTTDKNEIASIINYLNSLYLYETANNAALDIETMYTISIYYNNSNTKRYILLGNFFQRFSKNVL